MHCSNIIRCRGRAIAAALVGSAMVSLLIAAIVGWLT
jgi:hypothetical protein